MVIIVVFDCIECYVRSQGAVFKGTKCMTEASEKSNRNRSYFQQIISEHLAIEKNICNR